MPPPEGCAGQARARAAQGNAGPLRGAGGGLYAGAPFDVINPYSRRLNMVNRRTFLKTTGVAAGTAALGVPAVLRAQPKEIKIGAVHPVTGPLAEIGQACRLGAQTGPGA